MAGRVLALTLGIMMLFTVLNTASVRASTQPSRTKALNWAYTQKGEPYQWGGTGNPGYDCSGLVMMAYHHAGISLPRTTYEMQNSWHLVRESSGNVHPGDLAFYGSGHVELYVKWGWTYGAQEPGTRVGWHQWSSGWHPTDFYRVR